MSPSPLCCRKSQLALLLALTLPASPVCALTLGELRLLSFLGQPLRATVSYRLAPEEPAPEVRCLNLQSVEGELPPPGRPVLRIREQDSVIEIFSADTVNEPIIGFLLKSDCDGRAFSRSYTAFLDPEPVVSAPVAPIVQINPAPEPVPLPAKPAPTLRWPQAITPEQDTRVGDLAARHYPPQSRGYSKLVRALIAANPGLISADSPVTAGTKLRTYLPAPPKVKPTPKPDGEDRLKLVAEEPGQRAPTPLAKTREDPLLALQSQVATMQDLQLKMETEITQLRQSLKVLESAASSPVRMPAITASALAAVTSAPTQTASAPITPATTVTATDDNDRLAGLPFWVWLTGGIFCVGGLSFWLGRHGRIASGYVVRQGASASQLPAGAKVRLNIQREPISDASIIQQNPNGGIEVAEDESDIDRAQFLLAEGEVEEAIALLYKAIDENELDVERWLILFHVFRERMMKTEYALLAQRFHDLPPEEEDWELVSNLGRKIDPSNPLYVRIHTQDAQAPISKPAENPLDFLTSAAIAAPPQQINLDLPPLDPVPKLDFEKPADMQTAPLLPEEENKPEEDDDDFSKPCRY